MPAILEDPSTPHHVGPQPTANLSSTLHPRTVILKDHVTVATIIPILPGAQNVPLGLLSFLHEEFNREIERGDTYPMEQPLTLEGYSNYWFGTFAAVMISGNESTLQEGRDWANECFGTFYVKPNYPGRCNHICNGGFLVCHSARGKGVGRLLGEAYLEYAPKLNYTYSVFNLVFETNAASTKIWDSLGFKRIGLVKGAGRLEGHATRIDAIIYGRELGEDEDYVSEERFDKIRFYLEKGKYPPNADRSEKSRLRSATTHYRLEGNKLLLKDKEVISDGHEQYEIAKRVHKLNHGGINKTTAMIADKYHWVRIKETVSAVIKNCQECKETARAPVVRGDRTSNSPRPPGSQNQPVQPQQSQTQPKQQPQPQPPTTTGPPMMQQFDLSTLTPTTMVPTTVNLQSPSLQTQLQSQLQQSQLQQSQLQQSQLQQSQLQQSQLQQSQLQQSQLQQSQLQSPLQNQLQSPLQSQLGQPQGMPHPAQMSMGGVSVNLGVGVGGGDIDIPVDPAMMEDVTSHLTHTHHHQVQHHSQHHHQVQQHQQHHHANPHQVQHQHHLQHAQHIAPVAQMHAAASRLMVSGSTDGSDLQVALDNHAHAHQLDPHQSLDSHHASSAHSAEIARAALTEEDRAMRDQLGEALRGISDTGGDLGVDDGGMGVGVGVGMGGVGVGVGVGVVGVGVGVGVGQDMELDEGLYTGHTHAHGHTHGHTHDPLGDTKDHV